MSTDETFSFLEDAAPDHAAELARQQERNAAFLHFHEEKDRLYLTRTRETEAQIAEAARAALTPEERRIIAEDF